MTLKAPKINASGMVSAIEPTSNGHELINGRNDANGSGEGENGGMYVESSGPASAPVNNVNVRRNTLHAVLSSKLANLNDGAGEGERGKYELKNEDFREMQDLGQGNGGSVKKAEHIPTGTIMAKKVHHKRFTLAAVVLKMLLDGLDRREACGAQADLARASDHARLPLEIHHLVLRCLPRGA